ncbi:type II toxin-antitoxin system HicB family antitoxin [Pelomicrobium methylotrophicum]|uniref:Type II toxin-antitoxin system HicB family antitoxin n=1 Tax=Pelomicrobium methylotrophicum TaxID=2602750 RepID=A0A5C7EDH4_9PROT|nr:type II toxin-antitoxin system HicB family antitoxin [Pelomicrobium methylotrophicum]
MARYPIEVFWSDEDEGYIAIAPDLPGASAWGRTEAEAIQELHTVIDLWIKAANKAGNLIPKPSNPADLSYSGKFPMRVPESSMPGPHARPGPRREPEPVRALSAHQGPGGTRQAGGMTRRR